MYYLYRLILERDTYEGKALPFICDKSPAVFSKSLLTLTDESLLWYNEGYICTVPVY